MTAPLLNTLLRAQTRNSLLAGPELTEAGRVLRELLFTRELCALASDGVGERILGAALGIDSSLPLVDRSHRFDGCPILLVAGHMCGDASLAARALTLRRLGACRVEAAMLTEWNAEIEGCDAVWSLTGRASALFLPVEDVQSVSGQVAPA